MSCTNLRVRSFTDDPHAAIEIIIEGPTGGDVAVVEILHDGGIEVYKCRDESGDVNDIPDFIIKGEPRQHSTN